MGGLQSIMKDLDGNLYEEIKDKMAALKVKIMKEPKKPDMTYMSPNQQLKALAEYKTARNRWLKQLKHVESGSISVDYSITAHKQKRKKRTMKDTQWKYEQENRIPQQTITNFFKHKRRKKNVSE